MGCVTSGIVLQEWPLAIHLDGTSVGEPGRGFGRAQSSGALLRGRQRPTRVVEGRQGGHLVVGERDISVIEVNGAKRPQYAFLSCSPKRQRPKSLSS